MPERRSAILAQVAGALDAAHARGLVHRDVKPANILLSLGAGADQGDHAYLTDFGLTKRGGSETSLTAAGGFAGTLAYIAPEQVDGREIDGRADQYSLACMAFECLTGQVPFVRETDIATAMAHIKDPPPSALALQPTLPAAVDAVLARGMAKAPDDRYPTCGAFMADLRGALGLTGSYVAPVGRRRGRTASAARGSIVAVIALALAGRRRGLGRSAAAPVRARYRRAVRRRASRPRPSSPARRRTCSRTRPKQACCHAPGRSCDDMPPWFIPGGLELSSARVIRWPASPAPRRVSSGVNLVEIRRFPYFGTSTGNGGFTTESAISAIARRYGTKGGDCATRHGSTVAGSSAAKTPAPSSAIGSNDRRRGPDVVVQERGGPGQGRQPARRAPALYAYFDAIATFIQP